MRSVLLLLLLVIFACSAQAQILADHSSVAVFESLPSDIFQQVRNNARIYYGHASHGHQLLEGQRLLETFDGTTYARPNILDNPDLDLGMYGDLEWEQDTRAKLSAHPEINIVMWSWCDGMVYNSVDHVNIYLNAMNQLEQDFPGVKFVYMTGRLNGDGLDGTTYRNNNIVRAYCAANEKILFDFADIESYDPDLNYYPDGSDMCEWCFVWCETHDCPSSQLDEPNDPDGTCELCDHSHCFNCLRKGKALWWLLARMQGWNEQTPNTQMNLGTLKSLYR